MVLENKLSARKILFDIGMSQRPEFYSGRGAIIDDLTGKKIERIYEKIEMAYDKDTAQNFAQMVADIPVLSATDFLLSLYQLEANEWKWEKRLLSSRKGIYATDVSTAMGTVLSALGGSSKRDETTAIRNHFLQIHGIKIPDERNPYEERSNKNFSF